MTKALLLLPHIRGYGVTKALLLLPHKQLHNRIISPIISKICDVKKVMLKNDVKKISKNYVVLSKSVSVCKKSKIVFHTLTLGNIVSWFVLSFLFIKIFFVF